MIALGGRKFTTAIVGSCWKTRGCLSFKETVKVLVAQLCLTLRLDGLQPARLLRPWSSPGKNTGVGSHSLFQGIFPQICEQKWNGSCFKSLSFRMTCYVMKADTHVLWVGCVCPQNLNVENLTPKDDRRY